MMPSKFIELREDALPSTDLVQQQLIKAMHIVFFLPMQQLEKQ